MSSQTKIKPRVVTKNDEQMNAKLLAMYLPKQKSRVLQPLNLTSSIVKQHKLNLENSVEVQETAQEYYDVMKSKMVDQSSFVSGSDLLLKPDTGNQQPKQQHFIEVNNQQDSLRKKINSRETNFLAQPHNGRPPMMQSASAQAAIDKSPTSTNRRISPQQDFQSAAEAQFKANTKEMATGGSSNVTPKNQRGDIDIDRQNVLAYVNRSPAAVKVNNVEFSDNNSARNFNIQGGISTHYGQLQGTAQTKFVEEKVLNQSTSRNSVGGINHNKIAAANFSSTTRDLKQSPFMLQGTNPNTGIGRHNVSQHKILQIINPSSDSKDLKYNNDLARVGCTSTTLRKDASIANKNKGQSVLSKGETESLADEQFAYNMKPKIN